MVGFLGYPSSAFNLGFGMGGGMSPSSDILSGGLTAPIPAGSIPPIGSSLPDFSKMGGGIGGGIGQASPFGLNMDTAKLALSGLGTIGGLWGAFQAANMAKKQFSYTRDVTETNLANQLKTYNTQLTDRANNRAVVEGRTPAETAAYIDANKLSRYGR